jgi:autotransporter passenger strand-loop-strand repeat protein
VATTFVSSGVVSSGLTVSGGDQLVVLPAGTTSDTTVLVGGYEVVSSGGTAKTTSVGGRQDVFGTASGATLLSGGVEVVSSGGSTSDTIVSSGARDYVAGTAQGATVLNSGTQYVHPGRHDDRVARWRRGDRLGLHGERSGPQRHRAGGRLRRHLLRHDGRRRRFGDVAIVDNSTNGVVTAHGVSSIPSTASVVGFGDFDGSGRDEMLLRDTSGNFTYLTFASDDSVTNVHNPGAFSTAYQVAGVGDYDGSGRSEVLLYNSTTRDTEYLKIDTNGNFSGSHDLGTLPSGYKIVP